MKETDRAQSDRCNPRPFGEVRNVRFSNARQAVTGRLRPTVSGQAHPRVSSRSGRRTEKACQTAMSLRRHIYMGIICHGGEASC
jgi:hypothetical protein